MDIVVLLTLVWLHFIADFLFQTDKMALNKSSDVRWLSFHGFVYGLPFLLFGGLYAAVNAFAHVVTDAITSRITSRLYKQEKRHWFFVVIGLDQAIHLSTLLLTYKMFAV